MEPKSIVKRVKSFGVDINDIMAEASDKSGLTKRFEDDDVVITLEQPISKHTSNLNSSKNTFVSKKINLLDK